MHFTEQVRNLLSLRGSSINKMLKDLSLGSGTFATWEKNDRIPSGDVLLRIANYFEVPTDYLLGNTSPELTRRIELLKRRNLSYKELSEMTGISSGRLKRYFTQETWGYSDFFNEFPKLARTLGVSPQYLYCLTDNENDVQDTDDAFRSYVIQNSFLRDYFPQGQEHISKPDSEDSLNEQEYALIKLFRELNQEGQEYLLETADTMVSSSKYKKSGSVVLGKKQA